MDQPRGSDNQDSIVRVGPAPQYIPPGGVPAPDAAPGTALPGAAPQYTTPQQPAGAPYPPPPPPGYHQPIYITQQVQMAPAVIALPQKSMATAVLLALFFGPLGMLYATVPGAIIMLFVSIFVAAFTLGIGLLVTFPVCVIWAAVATNNYNMRLAAAGTQYSQIAR